MRGPQVLQDDPTPRSGSDDLRILGWAYGLDCSACGGRKEGIGRWGMSTRKHEVRRRSYVLGGV